MTRVAIVGGGDLGRQLAHNLTATGQTTAGYFDDTVSDATVGGLPVLGGLSDVSRRFRDGAFDALVIGIGYRHLQLRSRLFRELSPTIPFHTLVHPAAFVDPTAKIGEGSVVLAGCVIDMNAAVGPNSVLNLGCVVSHDSTIGTGCFLSPRVSIAGFSKIGDAVTLGIGTVVIDNVSVASGIRTGAGAVVTANLTIAGLYVGVPAALKKKDG